MEQQKCNHCKQTKNISEYGLYRKKIMKCCKDCTKKRNDKNCQHGKRKSQCKECGGSEICQHQRIRTTCVECEGSSICEHKRLRARCKECGGTSICEHKRLRTNCKECEGGSICEHKRVRARCVECEGSSICIHKKRKSRCVECEGTEICEHQKERRLCTICSPTKCIIHNQRTRLCEIFKKSVLNKTEHTIDFLGCTEQYFYDYMKSKFKEGMTFDNIHIDHIKPLSRFDTNNMEQLKLCCHYTNLQPLLAVDNLCKSNKWSFLDEEYWKNNICGKETTKLYIPI